MEIKIMTKNFSSNAGVEDLVRKELKSAERMFAPNTIFDVCIKKSKNVADKDFFKCDIMIKNGRQFVRGFGESEQVVNSIKLAVDSLRRKARKIKTAAIKKRKEYRKFIAETYDAEPEEIKSVPYSIDRTKEIDAAVMSPEEAVLQMELSGHNFFVFKDDSGSFSVVYKREQGYGLIIAR